MEINQIISKLPKEKQDTYENSSFMKKFGNFMVHYFTFIILFAFLLLWQLLMFLHSPSANGVLEVFIAVAITIQITDKFVKSKYFYILIAVTFAMMIIVHALGFPNDLWILLFAMFIGRKFIPSRKKAEIIE